MGPQPGGSGIKDVSPSQTDGSIPMHYKAMALVAVLTIVCWVGFSSEHNTNTGKTGSLTQPFEKVAKQQQQRGGGGGGGPMVDSWKGVVGTTPKPTESRVDDSAAAAVAGQPASPPGDQGDDDNNKLNERAKKKPAATSPTSDGVRVVQPEYPLRTAGNKIPMGTDIVFYTQITFPIAFYCDMLASCLWAGLPVMVEHWNQGRVSFRKFNKRLEWSYEFLTQNIEDDNTFVMSMDAADAFIQTQQPEEMVAKIKEVLKRKKVKILFSGENDCYVPKMRDSGCGSPAFTKSRAGVDRYINTGLWVGRAGDLKKMFKAIMGIDNDNELFQSFCTKEKPEMQGLGPGLGVYNKWYKKWRQHFWWSTRRLRWTPSFPWMVLWLSMVRSAPCPRDQDFVNEDRSLGLLLSDRRPNYDAVDWRCKRIPFFDTALLEWLLCQTAPTPTGLHGA